MEFDPMFKYGCFALGALGWLAVLYTMFRRPPLPWINLVVAALAVLLIALPSDSKLIMQVGAEEGLKFELTELSKQIDSLKDKTGNVEATLANLSYVPTASLVRSTGEGWSEIEFPTTKDHLLTGNTILIEDVGPKEVDLHYIMIPELMIPELGGGAINYSLTEKEWRLPNMWQGLEVPSE